MGDAVLYGIVRDYIDIITHHPFKQLWRDGHGREQFPEQVVEVIHFNHHVHRVVAARDATVIFGEVGWVYHYPGMPVNRTMNSGAENYGTH